AKTMTLFSTSYLVPAVLLNPVLLLHTTNTILSRTLPTSLIAPPLIPQSTPMSAWGPGASPPLLDVHTSDNFCWSYTMLMVGVQLVIFGRVRDSREARRERSAELLAKGEEERRSSSPISTTTSTSDEGIP
ncbi:MAG: hypothetical protein M1825_004509, partial [Sarcosagium campestre]